MRSLLHQFAQLLFFCLLYTGALWAQINSAWTDINESTIILKGERLIAPRLYRTLALDINRLKEQLEQAPMEFTPRAKTNPAIILLPMPNGSFQRFAVVLSPIMEPALAQKFPDIKTWSGQGIDDRTATLRLDITQFGFHAQVLSANGTVFIDPYSRNDVQHYISYYKRNFSPPAGETWQCLVPDDAHKQHPIHPGQGGSIDPRDSDGQLRTYRAAVAATGEYTAFHGGTVAGGLAAVTTSMNRVNGVYERDFSVRMNLVANNNLIIYTNSGTDPFSNNNPGALIDESQTTIDNVIGSANYDVGHTVSTGGGGLASLGVPCVNGSKASGVTGTSSPIGDPFDIDYLAHELGHQFGGSHTFNGNGGSCSGNRSASSAYEPGSGSTIMAYAGICGSSNDLQPNSDDYFHIRSVDQINTYTVSSSGNNCPVKTATGNQAPAANAGADFTIPKSTPFLLTGSGSDPNGDAITYCWEQYNLGAAGAPASPSGDAPIFRSFDPTTSPSRVFPKWSDIVNNTSTIGEVLPSYGRTLTFRLTVRDNRSGGGRTAFDAMNVVVADGAGPFTVTAPNTAVTWTAGSSTTVTWNVANTTASPVNCANVDILLSTDGGYTYPYTLATATPNDGTQTVVVPILPATTSTARVQVRGSGNIFFDISNVNFSIQQPATPTFVMAVTPAQQAVCAPANAVYTVNLTGFAGFSNAVNFSVAGTPAGTSINFAPTTVVPTGSTTLTLGNTGALQQGTYNVTITASGGSVTQTASVVFAVSSGTPAQAALLSPVNGAVAVSTTPTFAWLPIANASTYTIDIATDNAFTNIITSVNTLTTNTYTINPPLNTNTTYYWRARGQNGCANGSYSEVFSFVTVSSSCTTFNSTNVPVNISSSNTPTITSTLSISGSGVISDLNVKNLTGTHTWINDLSFSLASPAGTSVLLFADICRSENNFNINLDDEAASSNYPCPPVDAGTYKPQGLLSDFDGQNANGTWTLTVSDSYDQDGGALQTWGIEVCSAATPPTAFQVVQIKAFLEGPYNTGTGVMSTSLRTVPNLLPVGQPYNRPPWNYTGTETAGSATAIPPNATDWVIIEARSATNPATVVARKAGFLLSNGYVVDADGTVNGVKFTGLTNGTAYYFALRHRNHAPVLSALPLTLYNHQVSYDFTKAVARAYGNNQQKLLSNGVAACYAGDYYANSILNQGDYNIFYTQNPSSALYKDADGNLDRNVNSTDFDLFRANAGQIGINETRY